MTELYAFFDRDVFVKLICYDLWEDALQALGITHPFRLASATFNGANSSLRRKNIDEETKEKTLHRVKVISRQVPEVPEDLGENSDLIELFDEMIQTDGIDSGEALLAIAALNQNGSRYLITGDKRFLVTFADTFNDQFLKLRSSILSFEDCLISICKMKNIDEIRDKLNAASGCDRSLEIALGSNGDASHEEFTHALSSFLPDVLNAT